MQWSLDGNVNWSAPRHVALALTPLLATVVLFTVAISFADDPNSKLWSLILIALAFVAAHLLHLYVVARWTGNK